MVKISKKEVEHIAALSRIKLSESEKEKYRAELSAILDFVSELSKADTREVESLGSVSGLKNVVRQDKITNEPCVVELLKNVPHKEGFSIRTNKVLGGEPTA